MTKIYSFLLGKALKIYISYVFKSTNMNILPEIIGLMNKEEIRNFKLFVQRTNAGSDRKDILLFDYLRKHYPETDEEKIFTKLYPASDKNAFYRLKNRLLEDIGISLSLLNFNSSDINNILNNYLLAKIFVGRNRWDIANYYLGKAEKKAAEMESYELLDLIYNEHIKLSHEVLEINPEEYIEKRKKNRIHLAGIQEIDDILAMVVYKVKASQNFGKSNDKINELLNQVINSYSQNEEIKKSTNLRFKIYHSLSRILLQRRDYVGLEEYLLKTYEEFSTEQLFNKNNHDTKLQMLTYIANTLAYNEKTTQSLNYLNILRNSLQEFGGLLHDKYLFYYYNLMVINYAKNDIPKAIELLNEAKEEKVIKNHPLNINFVYMNLAVTYFGIKDYKSSLKSIVKSYMLDSFKTLGAAFRFKMAITELIVRYELTDYDFIEQRINQVKKEFKEEIKAEDNAREADLVKIILQLIQNPNAKADKKFKQTVKDFIEKTAGKSKSESEILDYNNWLKEKIS